MVATMQTIEQQQQELNAELDALRARQIEIDDLLAKDWKNDDLHQEAQLVAARISAGERMLGVLSDQAVEAERAQIEQQIEQLRAEHQEACVEAEKLGKVRDQLKAQLQEAERAVQRGWDVARDKSTQIRGLEQKLKRLQ